MSKNSSNTKAIQPHYDGQQTSQVPSQGVWSGSSHYQYPPNYYATVTPPSLFDAWQKIGPIEGVDELCLMLGVAPVTEPTNLINGFFLIGKSEKLYSLVDIIGAQLSIMQKLHVLLVHRDLTQGSGE